MPHIASIAYTPKDTERKPKSHFARTPLESATLIPRHGIEGDAKATRGERQLNVMFAEHVAQLAVEGFHAAPGELGEQLVIAGLAPETIVPGTQLCLGDSALIELYEHRTGCSRFAQIQGKPPSAADGRLGYMARIITGGKIAIGAPVTLASPPALEKFLF